MKTDSQQIKFRLITIESKQFAVLNEPKEHESIKIDTNIRFDSDFSKRIVVVTPLFKFIGNEPFLQIEVSCVFEIEAASWDKMFVKEDDNLTIPKGISQHLASLAVSTVRGILFEKTAHTKKIILPLINITKIITSDTILQKNKLEDK